MALSSILPLPTPPMDSTRDAAHSPHQDAISIQNLQLPFPLRATDSWGLTKPQPALISLQVVLSSGFASAAGQDRLDASTIHYGVLAKRIRGIALEVDEARDGIGMWGFQDAVLQIVQDLAGGCRAQTGPKDGVFAAQEMTLKIAFPKASMLVYGAGRGEEVDGLTRVVRYVFRSDGTVAAEYPQFVLRNLTVMTLIGVNAHERNEKQPVRVTLTITTTEAQNRLFGLLETRLERSLLKIIAETNFETLETLAEHVFDKLQREYAGVARGAQLYLKLAKPQAIVFADAPAIEIWRTFAR